MDVQKRNSQDPKSKSSQIPRIRLPMHYRTRLQGRFMQPPTLPTDGTPWLTRHLPHAASASTATSTTSGFIATAAAAVATATAPATAPTVLLASPVATTLVLIAVTTAAATTAHGGLILAIATCQERKAAFKKDKTDCEVA